MSNEKHKTYNLVIVGAGPAGIGVAIACRAAGMQDIVVLERYEVGASIRRWPCETRFISPSFPAHGFGHLDLNAISDDVSPGELLGQEHPDGESYAWYLEELVRRHNLMVQAPVDVQSISKDGEHFTLHTSAGDVSAKTVVWAAGEFQYPDTTLFPGSKLCTPVMSLRTYADACSEAGRIVIGGYESGCDVACYLAMAGTRVQMLDAEAPWDRTTGDPSSALSIRTRERVRAALHTGNLTCIAHRVQRVDKDQMIYRVHTDNGGLFVTLHPPLLAAGFKGSLGLLGDLIERDEKGHPVLTAGDESIRMPRLFVAGPMVFKNDFPLCFVYKFRTRFPVVASAVCRRLTEED